MRQLRAIRRFLDSQQKRYGEIILNLRDEVLYLRECLKQVQLSLVKMLETFEKPDSARLNINMDFKRDGFAGEFAIYELNDKQG